MKSVETISVIIPAKNEAKNIHNVLLKINAILPDAELLVINDGSIDNTADIAKKAGAKVISHPYSMGNGAAIKNGARNARGSIFVFMDADGQHNPDDIPRLLEKIDENFDMAVGARQMDTHASLLRRMANLFYNMLASFMTGYKIKDLTSGFRAVRARHFKRFLYLLPNGFSYPTSSTMAFFRSGLPIAYVSIKAGKREGKSHINLVKDGIRFFIIILRIGALFSPMRLFLPISASLLFSGAAYYSYTYITANQFTNMSALLLTSALSTFLIGLVSEQISSLHYKGVEETHRRTERE